MNRPTKLARGLAILALGLTIGACGQCGPAPTRVASTSETSTSAGKLVVPEVQFPVNGRSPWQPGGVEGPGGPSIIASANFTALATSGGVFTVPPSWLSISCATTGRTVQTSASTIVSGIGANAWRARNVGSGLGLSVESARENTDPYGVTGAASWTLGGATAVNATGPDGSTNTAATVTWTTGTSVLGYAAGLGSGAPYIASFWEIDTGGTRTIGFLDQFTGTPTTVISTAITWGRYQLSWGSAAPADLAWGTWAGAPNPNGQGTVWGAQIETGRYPSSVIPTAGTAASRAADVLSTTSAIAPSGRLNMTAVVAPNFASGEQGVDSPILWWNSTNQIFLQQSTGKIVIELGGVAALVSAALTWSREQAITVAAHLAPSGALSLTVSGATTGNGTTNATGVGTFSTGATSYLLGTSSGAQECADLRSVSFAAP